jgi:hypothetical protein
MTCPHHGHFTQLATNHLQGRGCSICRYDKIAQDQNFSTKEFLELARSVHGEKYDYSKVDYRNNHTKVPIVCAEHGEFRQRPQKHLRGAGCKKCGIVLRANKHRLKKELFVQRSRSVHGERYDYDKVDYRTAHTKVAIVCRKHGPFEQEPNSHVGGVGCPKCSESKGEGLVRRYLEAKKIAYRQEHLIRKIGYFDFAVKRRDRVFIEFHGGQHYHSCTFGSKRPHAGIKTLISTIRRDRKKERWCQDNRVPLLVIPYWDYRRIWDILDEFLAGKPPTISEPPEKVKKYEAIRQRIVERLVQIEKNFSLI